MRAKDEDLAAVEVEPPRETLETIVIDLPWPMTKLRARRAAKALDVNEKTIL
jgi:hypothetical protein